MMDACSTQTVSHYWDSILNPVRATLIAVIMMGYEFDVGQLISRVLQDRAVRREKLVLAFPCLVIIYAWKRGC